ncbi:uncharacterized protein TNCV_1174891 [Trichonephila clavipes]|nr:uncharacterized protein TNCV_1174891 [Trichonephila clavipes]
MHGQCPIGKDSWCYYQRALSCGKKPKEKYKGLSNEVLNMIKPTYLELCTKELLTKCLHGKTQNSNECLNGVIWQRVPKEVFMCLKTLKSGALDDVIQFNDGYKEDSEDKFTGVLYKLLKVLLWRREKIASTILDAFGCTYQTPCSRNEDCHNGGICSGDRVCFCAPGYKGDICEQIIGCDELNCDPEISYCILNEETEEGMCQCKERGKVYFQNMCLESCKDDRECQNGGVCGPKNVCGCKRGTKGDYCEIITGCEELICDMEISDCIFDHATETGKCKCKDESKVYIEKKCVVTCEKDNDCPEGEKCKKEGGVKFCRCPTGTSGDKCSVIDDCVDGKYKNCKGDKGTCKYFEEGERAFCECENDKKLDPTVAFCKGTCEVKEDCRNEADCVKPRGASFRFCKCKSPFEGDFCEIVKECKLVRYANCKGENGTCVYSKEAKRAICKCGEKKELDISVTYCKDCYCGENGNCTITNGVKTCICNQNYTEGSDGICHAECKSDADCENGGTCSRNLCHCTNGTSGDDCRVISGCDKLNCNRINAQCTFDILNKVATCTCRNSSRVYVNNECMECQCGKYSTSCKFDRQGKKICECENGYSPRNGTCTDNTITDTRKELMVYTIQREFKQIEVSLDFNAQPPVEMFQKSKSTSVYNIHCWTIAKDG